MLRFLSVFFATGFLLAGLSGLALGAVGLWIGLGLTVVIFLVALLASPQILDRIQPGVPTRIKLAPDQPQTLHVLPDPSANILVMRSLLPGSARIYVSQGALALMSQSELVAVVREAEGRCRNLKLISQSACAALASPLCRLAPSRWVRTALHGQFFEALSGGEKLTFGTVSFLTVLPWIRFLLWAGGPEDRAQVDAAKSDLNNALRKIENENLRWPYSGNVAATQLHQVHPWKKQGLLAF